ncbi:hypothetical protein DID78_04490 [Candidatus Marinamargulisbacteria bacterium SCGC AG-343-D04]|nr:hypothetical protein DID78_04490 [Candidatus Marinamargulisbacteria bacterium SCGC AG-343-D04]
MLRPLNTNPLDELGINREHIISIQEAFTHTNKKASSKRAKRLFELLEILKKFDKKRKHLQWDE